METAVDEADLEVEEGVIVADGVGFQEVVAEVSLHHFRAQLSQVFFSKGAELFISFLLLFCVVRTNVADRRVRRSR